SHDRGFGAVCRPQDGHIKSSAEMRRWQAKMTGAFRAEFSFVKRCLESEGLNPGPPQYSLVMPADAGIHDLAARMKPWMPGSAFGRPSMTGAGEASFVLAPAGHFNTSQARLMRVQASRSASVEVA